MFTHLRLLLSIFSFMAFTTDSGKDDPDENPDPDPNGPPVDDEQDPKDDKKPKFTDEQSAEIGRIVARETRKAADKARADRDAEIAAEKAAADAEAKRKADEEAGEYEKAKEQLTSDLESAQKQRDEALELLKANVDTQWDDLPDEVKATYTGEEDDVLAKSSHMNLMKPVIDRLKSEAEKAEERKNPGNPKNPKPTDRATTTDEDEAAKRTVRPRL